jgi:hypothetical protein
MHNRLQLFRWIAVLIVVGFLITSCTSANLPTSEAAQNHKATETILQTSPETTIEPEENLPEGEENSPQEMTATSYQPTPTPIIETRLPPERWMEWPVVPELTGREIAIYQLGQELGNDPTNFSKVGDCQAIKDVLMGIYDKPDRYFLTENDAYLQETVDQFAGSFDRDGQGVRGGFNAAAVISPIWADPEACNPGETPIECEYRIHKPSFVIISLEVWWEGRTVERYEEYMRQIIDFYISNGVVPILSTKADNVEGDHRINLATARLAYEYHIPLWNFWRAVQSLPNHGIDPNRDGFHISYEAWTVRSYSALQALDAVWRGVSNQEIVTDLVIETPVPDSTTTATEILFSPEVQIPNVPLATERLIFAITQRSGDEGSLQGIFAYSFENQALYRLLEPGYDLEDVDPEGATLLISKNQELFVADQNGKNLRQVTDQLAITSRDASAFWMPNSEEIVLLTQEGENTILWKVNPSNDQWQKLAEGNITGIIKPKSDTIIFWYQGECEDPDLPCENVTLMRTENGQTEAFIQENQIVLSNTGENFAWVEPAGDNTLILYTRGMAESSQNYLYLPGNRLVDISWSPIFNQLALLAVTRSNYSGKSSDAQIIVVNTNTMLQQEYWTYKGLNPRLYWSQEGDQLLLTSTLAFNDSYQLNISQLNLNTNQFTSYNEDLTITSEDFITINTLYWIIP